MIYVGIDGDDIGAKLELFLLKNDEKKIKSFSKDVDYAITCMSQLLVDLGMEIIFRSGDSVLCRGNHIDSLLQELSRIVEFDQYDFSFSVGVGYTLKDTYIALKYAKTSGKNRIVMSHHDRYETVL